MTKGHSVMDRKKKRKSPVAVLCSALGTVLLILLVALCLPLTLPRVMGYDIYTVISGSMEPSIPTGSLVYIEGAQPEDIEAGDVIAFYGARDSAAVITHRVVENNTLMGQFVTKGDANEKADVNPVSYEEFIGKLALSIPYLGRLAQLFTSTSGKIGAGIVILADLLLHVIGTTFEKRTEKSQQKRS